MIQFKQDVHPITPQLHRRIMMFADKSVSCIRFAAPLAYIVTGVYYSTHVVDRYDPDHDVRKLLVI